MNCPIPWCPQHEKSISTDVEFLKLHMVQKHDRRDRTEYASSIGIHNYSDGGSHFDYLISPRNCWEIKDMMQEETKFTNSDGFDLSVCCR